MNLELSNLRSLSKKLRYGERPRPWRDWFVLLVLFLIAIAASLVFNLLTFSRVTHGQKVGNAQVAPPAQIQLDQVRSLFSARAAERARYAGDYRFVDPSR